MTRTNSGGLSVTERWDTLYDQLSANPRRKILLSLLDAGGGDQLPLPEAAIFPNDTVDRHRYGLELRHFHLPSLASAGLVTWRDEPFTVSRGPRFHEVEAVLAPILQMSDQLPVELTEGCDAFDGLDGIA